MTTQLLRLLSASAVRRRERLARAENGFSTSTSTSRAPSTSTRTPSTSTRAPSTSTRTPSNLVTPSSPSPRNVVSAVHLTQKTNSHNKLISQMGHLLANEEGSQKKPSMPPSPRQFTTSRRHPDGGQRLPPWKVYNSDLTKVKAMVKYHVIHFGLLLTLVQKLWFSLLPCTNMPLCDRRAFTSHHCVVNKHSARLSYVHLHWWTILNRSKEHISPYEDVRWHLDAEAFRSSSTLHFAHILHRYIYTGCFFNWYPPKKLKYVKPRLGESTLT